jgi:cobalamin transport system ATP-binding protein
VNYFNDSGRCGIFSGHRVHWFDRPPHDPHPLGAGLPATHPALEPRGRQCTATRGYARTDSAGAFQLTGRNCHCHGWGAFLPMDSKTRETRGILVVMLKIDSLTVAYSNKIVLRNVSFEVQPGEILALIGPNGAGKSTLIRAASGVVPIASGRISMDGQDLTGLSTAQRARILAVVPQARQLRGAFSVEQAVMMGRTPYLDWLGREGESDRAAVRSALEQTCLETFAKRQIAKLSGGEQQRVLLARALAQSTPVLLLDEPTNDLDLKHQTNLLSLVKNLAKKKHLTVLMALHDLNLVSLVADKVALLVEGELRCLGTPRDVLRAEHISVAYRTPVEIIHHPVTGAPIIFSQEVFQQAE